MSRKFEKAGARRYPAQASERTSFVGREDDLGELARLFGGEARLVSVVGPPGMGKTRLALRFFRGWEEGECPAFFCDVREAKSSAELASAVARVLSAESLSGSEGDEWVAQLGGMLDAHGRCLLVLDNFEQLVPVAAATFGRWLAAAPELRVLVTSRRVLRLTGEHVRDLVPLSVRGVEEEMAAPGECGEALRLFVDRASSVSSFAWDSASDDTREATVRLVRLLEGIPLALELAAGQLRRATPQELETKLEKERLSLSSAWADVDPRHATLRAAIEGSWRLLTSEEQTAIQQLTVFRRGFTEKAAAAVLVAGRDSAGGILADLRDASLLRESESASDPTMRRWEMYASVREFAGEKLAACSGDECLIRTRHASYFVELARSLVASLETTEEAKSRGRLSDDVANLETSFRWFSRNSGCERLASLFEVGLALNAAYERVLPGRAVEWMTCLLALYPDDASYPGDKVASSDVIREVILRLARARAWREIGEYEEAERDLNLVQSRFTSPVLSVAADLGTLSADHRFERGMIAFKRGDIGSARESFEKARELADEAGAGRVLVRSLTRLGFLCAEALGDPIAFQHYERARHVASGVGDGRGELLADMCSESHRVHFQRGPTESALISVIRRAEARGERWIAANGWIGLGLYWQDRENPARACESFAKAGDIALRAGLRYSAAAARFLEGAAFAETNDFIQSLACYRAATVAFHRLGAERAEGLARVFCGGLLARNDNLMEAADEWRRGHGLLLKSGDVAFRVSGDLQRGHLLLARARNAKRRGTLAEATRFHRSAERLIRDAFGLDSADRLQENTVSSAVRRSAAARMALRTLQSEMSGEGMPVRVRLAVSEDGGSFRMGSLPPVEFPRGSEIRRALLLFARACLESPGQVVSGDEVLRICWPGEAPVGESGAVRVRGVVRRLRRAGLEELLVTDPSGYLLNPDVELTIGSSV